MYELKCILVICLSIFITLPFQTIHIPHFHHLLYPFHKGGVLASCGDEGALILWHQRLDTSEDGGGVGLLDGDDNLGGKETWRILQIMR